MVLDIECWEFLLVECDVLCEWFDWICQDVCIYKDYVYQLVVWVGLLKVQYNFIQQVLECFDQQLVCFNECCEQFNFNLEEGVVLLEELCMKFEELLEWWMVVEDEFKQVWLVLEDVDCELCEVEKCCGQVEQ